MESADNWHTATGRSRPEWLLHSRFRTPASLRNDREKGTDKPTLLDWLAKQDLNRKPTGRQPSPGLQNPHALLGKGAPPRQAGWIRRPRRIMGRNCPFFTVFSLR